MRLSFFDSPEVPDLRSFAYRRLLRRIVDLDWHVHVYVDGPRLADVIAALEDTGVKLVIDHFGMPDPKLGGAGPDLRTQCPRALLFLSSPSQY